MIRIKSLLVGALLFSGAAALGQSIGNFTPQYAGGAGSTISGTGCLTGVSNAIQKGDGSNGCVPAVSGTDYQPPTNIGATANQFVTSVTTSGTGTKARPTCGNLSDSSTGCSTTVGTIATQNANSVAITGGTIDGATVGATTPASIKGTTVQATTEVLTPASASGGAGLNLPHGAAPTSPVNGDIWTTTAGLFARINGSTVGPYGTGGGGSGCNPGGAAGNLLTDSGSGVCTSNSDATFASGKVILGINTSEAGSVEFFGGTSGNLTLKVAAIAGTNSIFTFPGGTTDLSATGGTSQVLKQVSTGAPITVARLACSDLSDSSASCASGLSTTDGTHTVTGTTSLTLNSPFVVGGSAGAATVSYLPVDTTHTTSVNAANIGGQDDYNGSSLTATLSTLSISGQTLAVTNQNSSVLTISNNSQTVAGLPLSTSLHTGGFYAYIYNGVQINAYGFPGFGTITTNALSKYLDASGATGASTIVDNGGIVINSATGGAQGAGTVNASGLYVGGVVVPALSTAETWTGSQRGTVQSVSISTATYTPNFDTGNNFTLTLVHASCPCTLANPSTTPVAGQSGTIEVIQSATGSDVISTWGSNYTTAGGTSSITLSTGANARDYLSYYVADATHIVLSPAVLNATH